jgi:hypothetical protein
MYSEGRAVFDLSLHSIVSGVILSGVGLLMFMHGRRESDPGLVLGGIALGLLPLFIHSILWLWLAVGGVIVGVLCLRRLMLTGPAA